ncbi:hypothetical protein THAOC_22987 [Thalassiosira oceanica]|uniref:Uncharacterized protein n=1 Tax=Thalassiosira oceanica TaxID=159749 RepID=K0RVJ5_THAOC|nr:hypothetical protein THAOC_22987 [Thalassiosira oceanica]|eukprot:EJK57015.1 hypothetical protein THAOC_22987 [Thalassiosira oceanica]
MAGYRSSKRPRSTSGASKESPGGDESEPHALRSEVARLREQLLRSDAENGRLHQHVVPVPTVDLSRLDTSLATHIASFVGTSLERCKLELTCKSLGWKQPLTGLNLSLAEEVTQQVVCSRRAQQFARLNPTKLRSNTCRNNTNN